MPNPTPAPEQPNGLYVPEMDYNEKMRRGLIGMFGMTPPPTYPDQDAIAKKQQRDRIAKKLAGY